MIEHVAVHAGLQVGSLQQQRRLDVLRHLLVATLGPGGVVGKKNRGLGHHVRAVSRQANSNVNVVIGGLPLIGTKRRKLPRGTPDLEEARGDPPHEDCIGGRGYLLTAKARLLYPRSLPHRLGRGSRILSRHEREKGCGTHLRGLWDPAWVLVVAWSPWRLSVSRWRGRRLGRDPDDLRVANGTGDGGRVGRRRGAGGEQSRHWLRLTTRSARV
jgi:hypothetical protein